MKIFDRLKNKISFFKKSESIRLLEELDQTTLTEDELMLKLEELSSALNREHDVSEKKARRLKIILDVLCLVSIVNAMIIPPTKLMTISWIFVAFIINQRETVRKR